MKSIIFTHCFAATFAMLFPLFLLFSPSLCLLSAPKQRHTNSPTVVTWSATNSLFSNSSSSSLPSSPSSSLVVYDGTLVQFECPPINGESDQWLVISAVSEMSLIECQLDSASTPFLICDGTNDRNGKTLMFQREVIPSAYSSTSAVKNNTNRTTPNIEPILYRQSGTVHYFISTSNGTNRDGMWNSRGGLCALKNMRIRVEFSEDTPPAPPPSAIADGTTWVPLEYSIEEMPTWPIDQQNLAKSGGGKAAQENGDEGGRADTHNRLAKSLRIKPEYLEFVRNHAIRGGTGDIRFPPTEEDAHDERVKWPRFVSRNSENPWRRARPSAALYSTNEAMGKEAPEERHTNIKEKETDNGINGNSNNNGEDGIMMMKGERTRHKGNFPSPALPNFAKDQLIWTTSSSAPKMKQLMWHRLGILAIAFAFFFSFRLFYSSH